QVVALYNRTRARAEALGEAFGIGAIYNDPEELLASEEVDAVDIITGVDSHSTFVRLATSRGLPAICQKPLAPSLTEAEAMLATCRASGTRLLVHENWRWQTPIQEIKRQLESGVIGEPFRARLQFSSSFPVFDNQPFLRELEQFILTDMGSHILDVARFLFGEAQRLYCQTGRVNSAIQGEDVATVILRQGGVTTTCELSYASRLEHERFPETYMLIEGSRGSLELGPDYWIRCTTVEGTLARRTPPPRYAWADPAYDLVHASIVPCLADVLRDLRDGVPAETRGEDNINTTRLVFAAYESARTGQAVVPNSTALEV
ncbi:MAG: putative oxidoreductase YcjS, partial [Chloroflexota bacterium]